MDSKELIGIIDDINAIRYDELPNTASMLNENSSEYVVIEQVKGLIQALEYNIQFTKSNIATLNEMLTKLGVY